MRPQRARRALRLSTAPGDQALRPRRSTTQAAAPHRAPRWIQRRRGRQAGRPWPTVRRESNRHSQRYADGFDDVAKNGFGSFRFLLQRRVARTGHNAMREYGNSELLEIIGQAVVAAVEEGASLRRTLQHKSAARTNAKRKLVAVPRASDNFEC